MADVYEQSLELHRQHHGKLEVASKVPLKNRADLSVAYTPGVAEVCRLIAADKAKSFDYTCRGNMVAVVSDGSAILGLGNLGAEAAMPVMEGKCVLFKAFGGVDAVPICLATQNSDEIVQIVKALAPSFGGINLEDISAPRCFEIEERLKKELTIPVMHDDQHGTATVVLAALINALRLRELDKTEAKLVINGSGAAGVAVTDLLLKYGFENITVCDTKGTIYEGRPDLNDSKVALALKTNRAKQVGTLAEAVAEANVFVGVSAPGVLTVEMVKSMVKDPIIMALANPVPEIMPSLAKEAGAFIVASGRSDFPNQINNVLAFPGIFRGALDNKVRAITDEMLIAAAQNLAAVVEQPTVDLILPDPFDPRVALAVAKAIYE